MLPGLCDRSKTTILVMINKKKMKMKTTVKFIALLFTLTLFLGFVSCDDKIETPQEGQNIVPERFSVDIPQPLTRGGTNASGRVAQDDDDLSGNDIYGNLGYFIALAEGSAARFTLCVGPLPLRWKAVQRGVSERGFTDVQAEGPARKW